MLELSTTDRERLIDLDLQLVEIASWLNLSRLLNPTLPSRQRALAELRQGSRTGRYTDPRLEYLPIPRDVVDRSYRALAALQFGDTELDDLLGLQRDALRDQLDLLLARGTDRFAALATTMYGLPSPELLGKAHAILRGEYLVQDIVDPPDVDDRRLQAPQMQRAMEGVLQQMGIHDWRVVLVDEMSARMSVSARHREVRVKTDSEFTVDDRNRLIVHELGTHVLRAHNGFKSGLLNLGLGLAGYIATEEGLASWMEERNGLLRRAHIEIYAMRAIGAQLAHELGFADMMVALMDLGATPGVAWDVALRLKRGLVDTSRPGTFPKDYVYLHGREIVTAWAAAGGAIDDLFVAKIAIDQVEPIKRLLATWSPHLHRAS